MTAEASPSPTPSPSFDIKNFIDREVVQSGVLGSADGANALTIHSLLWNGNPPKEVLVFLVAGDAVPWGHHVKRLLESGWRFDFLRDLAVVVLEGKRVAIFGGDGAPYFDPSGQSSVRLWRKCDDGRQLILQVGAKWPSGTDAAAAVKAFFGLFESGPLEMVAKYAAPFGSA